MAQGGSSSSSSHQLRGNGLPTAEAAASVSSRPPLATATAAIASRAAAHAADVTATAAGTAAHVLHTVHILAAAAQQADPVVQALESKTLEREVLMLPVIDAALSQQHLAAAALKALEQAATELQHSRTAAAAEQIMSLLQRLQTMHTTGRSKAAELQAQLSSFLARHDAPTQLQRRKVSSSSNSMRNQAVKQLSVDWPAWCKHTGLSSQHLSALLSSDETRQHLAYSLYPLYGPSPPNKQPGV